VQRNPTNVQRATGTSTITHPNGLTATFNFEEVSHPRNEVPYIYNVSLDGATRVLQDCYDTFAIKNKTLSGPGINNLTWSYNYSEGDGSFIGAAHSVENKWTEITHPNGVKHKQYFHIDYDWTDGQKFKEQWYSPSGTLLSTVTDTFQKGKLIGIDDNISFYNNEDNSRYLKKRTTQVTDQKSNSYTNTFSNFDGFDRALTTVGSNTFSSGTRTEVKELSDYLTDWVLGLSKKITVNGTVTTELNFCTTNTTNCRKYLPYNAYKFGAKVVDWTYNSDGTYKTIKDANNNAYTFSNYKAGLPRTIVAVRTTVVRFI